MTCGTLQVFFSPLFLLCPSPGVGPFLSAEWQSVCELGCSIFRTVSVHSSFCITRQSREPWRSSCQALQGSLSTAGLECQLSQGKAVGVQQGMLCCCVPWWEEGVWILIWELQLSTEGQKLGAALKINLGMGARSGSNHVLVGEHSRRGGLSCTPPSSVLRLPDCCVEVWHFLMEGFAVRKKYFHWI